MSEPLKTTIYLAAADYRKLKALAAAQGRPAAELVREAVSEYAARHAAGVTRPRSIGRGSSGRGDVAERSEELLAGMGRRSPSKPTASRPARAGKRPSRR
jgi:hypothetical protein